MRLSFGVAFLTFVLAATVPRLARALDCPCTWEEVICSADAVAEVEVSLATKTSPDHATFRRVIWNGTKHRLRTPYGEKYFNDLTLTRAQLQWYVKPDPEREPGRPEPTVNPIYRQALRAGRYKMVVFLRHYSGGSWSGGGLVFNGVEWLSHPLHDEWWKRLQPLLAERIRLYGEGKKPAACDVTRDTTRYAKFDLYGYDTALELTGDKRFIH